MLWDLIRDFFVQHVFGGTTSAGEYISPFWGLGAISNGSNYLQEDYEIFGDTLFYPIAPDTSNSTYTTYINASDWLSTTATMISITIIVVLCCLFIYKIVRLIGGLIR